MFRFLSRSLFLAPCLMLVPNVALASSCNYGFKFVTTTTFGSMPAGTELRGDAEFTVTDSMKQEGGVEAFPTEGTFSFGSETHGRIESKMRVFNVARTNRMLDYYGMEAGSLKGELGGYKRFVPLANMAFYGAGDSITEFEVPSSAEQFANLVGRRVLQLQTPNGDDVMLADIVDVSGGCA